MNAFLYLCGGLLLLITGLTQAAPDGARLYAQNCAVCHGESGTGGVGVPLALPAFLASVDDAYLRETMLRGRPGRVMPAFTRLSGAEIDAIIGHLRGWQKETEAPRFSTTPVAGDAAKGAALFAQKCAACHGEHGQGGHGTGVTFSRPRDLPIIAPALNNPGFLAAASDELIKATLLHGREGTPMQSFLQQGLTEQDINDVVSYVRSFATTASEQIAVAEEPAMLVLESPYSFEETIESVKRAAVGKNFRLIRDQILEDGLYPPEQQNSRQMMVYFCNFKFLYDAMALDPRVGLFLPCRVTVVEQDGKVLVMTINPKRLAHLFNNAELDRACDAMYKLYEEILEEATL